MLGISNLTKIDSRMLETLLNSVKFEVYSIIIEKLEIRFWDKSDSIFWDRLQEFAIFFPFVFWNWIKAPTPTSWNRQVKSGRKWWNHPKYFEIKYNIIKNIMFTTWRKLSEFPYFQNICDYFSILWTDWFIIMSGLYPFVTVHI